MSFVLTAAGSALCFNIGLSLLSALFDPKTYQACSDKGSLVSGANGSILSGSGAESSRAGISFFYTIGLIFSYLAGKVGLLPLGE